MTVAQVTTQLRPSQQPRLPAAPVEYDRNYIDSLTSILRQYFNQVDNLNQSLLTNTGGRFFRTVCGSFYDTTQQTNTANTAKAITLNSTDTTGTNGVSVVSGSRVTVTYPGIYNMQFSIQAQNTDNAQHDISIWIKQYVAVTATLADLPGSTGFISIPARKSAGAGNEGHGIYGWNYFISMAASDYIELYWSTTNAAVTIQNYAAGTSPTRPSTSSVVLTMSFVSAPLT
jgi:hypothetical protein